MKEILGHVDDYSVKEAWDILQQRQRELHLAGFKKESPVCGKCHHGSIKKRKELHLNDTRQDNFTYDRQKDFKGHGLHKNGS